MNFLRFAWKKWLRVAHVIGNFQAQVILTVFYFTFVLPFGVIGRFFTDPLRLDFPKKRNRSNFQEWKHRKDTIDVARRQF